MRALIKAELGNLITLRAATIEQLTAVPGMSEIKARYIHTYLQQFSAESLDVDPVPKEATDHLAPQLLPVRPQWPESLNLNTTGIVVWSASRPGLAAIVVQEAEHALNLALRLLLTEAATGYRARLLRETIGFMHLVQGLLQCVLPEPKEQDRAVRRLQTISVALSNAIAAPELDRKAQTRLADELAQAGDRLENLIGQTLRRRSTEPDDE